MKLINKICLWWKFDGRYILSDFWYGIKNLFKWLKIIYRDRDWDQSYIFDILQFKLENQAKYIGSRDFHVGAKRDAEKMRLCACLIEKIKTGYYETEYFPYSDTNLEFIPKEVPNISEKMYEIKFETLSENFDEFFKKYPLIYKRVLNSDSRELCFSIDSDINIARNICYINHQRAKRLLFTLLDREIDSWWE